MVYSPYPPAASSPHPDGQVQNPGYGPSTGHRPHAPVCPTGYYQAPDGGMTFVYPSEVIDKYLSTKGATGASHEHQTASLGPSSAPPVAYLPHAPASYIATPHQPVPSQHPTYGPGPIFHPNPYMQHGSHLPPQAEAYQAYNRGYDGRMNEHMRRPYTVPGSG
jgi:hypothetical protein